jgi:hypothetical protein
MTNVVYNLFTYEYDLDLDFILFLDHFKLLN